jgi:quinol monooxygenase YgiN
MFTVLESWTGDDTLDAHRAAPHMGDFKSACGPMILEKNALPLISVVQARSLES